VPSDVAHLLEAGAELVRRPVPTEGLVEVVERVAGCAAHSGSARMS
jgi:hypothetical protein